MSWTIATRLSDGSEVISSFRFLTRRGAARWAQLATLGCAARHVWQPRKVRR